MNTRNILSYTPLVKKIAVSVRKQTRLSVELDDLVSAGTLALLEADKSFNPQKNVPYDVYLSKRIRWGILDELRRHGPMPYYQYRRQPNVSFTSDISNLADPARNSSEIIDFLIEALDEDELPVLYALASSYTTTEKWTRLKRFSLPTGFPSMRIQRLFFNTAWLLCHG